MYTRVYMYILHCAGLQVTSRSQLRRLSMDSIDAQTILKVYVLIVHCMSGSNIPNMLLIVKSDHLHIVCSFIPRLSSMHACTCSWNLSLPVAVTQEDILLRGIIQWLESVRTWDT